MKAWSRIVALFLALTLLLQTAEGVSGCATRGDASAPMQSGPMHHHSGQPAHSGHQSSRHSCGPTDGAECLAMTGCIAPSEPGAAGLNLPVTPSNSRPLAALADHAALHDITPESPPPRT